MRRVGGILGRRFARLVLSALLATALSVSGLSGASAQTACTSTHYFGVQHYMPAGVQGTWSFATPYGPGMASSVLIDSYGSE
jgi:hypothetical protein